MDKVVKIFKALGDETRLKILIILSGSKMCAKGIAKHLDISESAVSQHIRVLKGAEIIVGEKVGYFSHYQLQDSALLKITEFIEQMNNDHEKLSTKLGTHVPHECKAKCKVDKNKCCQNNK